MVVDLPGKLRLAADALGCRSQKELYNRLLAVNPDTAFDPVRSYKWLQGKASPRDWSIYQDLADALGLKVAGSVIRTCSLAEFSQMVSVRLPGAAARADLSDLDGRYLLYMPSFSNFPSPMIVRCAVRIVSGVDGTRVRIDVPMPSGTVAAEGSLAQTGRVVHATAGDQEQGVLLMLWFAAPARPVRVIGGLIGGVNGYIAEVVPHCGRAALVRVLQDSVDIEPRRFFMDIDQALIASDVGSAVQDADPSEIARQVIGFLRADADDRVINAPDEAVAGLFAPFEQSRSSSSEGPGTD